MNLIIDIGNTQTKVALVNNFEVVKVDRHDKLSIDLIEKTIQNHHPKKAIVSVVGEYDLKSIQYLKSLIPTTELDYRTNLPIKNLYKTPETLGLDRIAAAAGAAYLYPDTNLLVIDSGTAITYDFIDAKGQYHGGAISPGIRLRFKALNQFTANLPLLDFNESYPLIGVSTSECIRSGVMNGIVGEVDSYIDQVKAKYPEITVVLTGGDSNIFVNKLKNSIFVVQNLVLIGLNRILEFNV